MYRRWESRANFPLKSLSINLIRADRGHPTHHRTQESSFTNDTDTSRASMDGRLNGNGSHNGGHNSGHNGNGAHNGGGGLAYPESVTVKLALNGVRKRRVRCGAVKVDLSCADKSIRRPDSAPDLIRDPPAHHSK